MRIITFLTIHFLFIFFGGYSQPRLQKNGDASQLIVNEKPFLVLGGELYNSSTSNKAFMNPLWKPLKQMHLNTVLAAVSWELIEPAEGKFDFTLVDDILKGAGSQHLKVVLLWFASWKNGLSHYTPLWVKQDTKRFPRIQLEYGKSTETLTALSTESAAADAKAFAALMEHVKAVDAQQQTVIMIQVENEVGVIGGTRDHSAFANTEFNKPVPAALMKGLQQYKNELQPEMAAHWAAAGSKTNGTWSEVFGDNAFADEAFMAWNYAKYINTVAAAGKAAYNIPFFVNTWVVQPEDKKPGDYPAGGPQSQVHDIWRIAAPAIDIKSPDIYLPDFKRIVAMYHHSWNPLFIPESFSAEDGAANAFYAIGNHNGIGYSPFGIDKTDPNPDATPIAKAYNILAQLTPEVLSAQAKGTIKGFSLTKSDSAQMLQLGGYTIQVTLRKNWNGVVQTS
jgi:beta-galactosidase GanA